MTGPIDGIDRNSCRWSAEFIVSNISTEVWYHPMVELARRLRNPPALQEAVAGLCRGIRQQPADSSVLVVGLGQTGTDIVDGLTGFRIDCQQQTTG